MRLWYYFGVARGLDSAQAKLARMEFEHFDAEKNRRGWLYSRELATVWKMAGCKVPTDRAVYGVNQGDLLLGKQERSNREGFVIYVGNEITA